MKHFTFLFKGTQFSSVSGPYYRYYIMSLQTLIASILADKEIDAQEVVTLRAVIFDDGVVDIVVIKDAVDMSVTNDEKSLLFSTYKKAYFFKTKRLTKEMLETSSHLLQGGVVS